MPVTRSGSLQDSQPHGQFHLKSKPLAKANVEKDEDVIVISDDEGATVGKRLPNLKRIGEKQRGKGKTTSRTKPLLSISEVVDISSSDDENSVRQERSGSTQQLLDLKEKLKVLEREKAILQEENTNMKVSSRAEVASLYSKLEDHITCEICTLKIWSPYILPQCGHTFCQSCLVDWFDATLKSHSATYPTFNNANFRRPFDFMEHYQAFTRMPNMHPLLRTGLQMQLAVEQGAGRPPAPELTCPTCRKTVKDSPVEDFALKGVVRTVATLLDERSPKKAPANNVARRNGEPWNRYFSVT